MIIRFNGRRFLRAFFPFLIIVAISLIVNFDKWIHAPTWTLWTMGIFFAFLLFGCLVMPRRYFLELQPEGLTIQYITSKKFYTWSEVDDFRVIKQSINHVPMGSVVGFNLNHDSPHRTRLIKLANASRRIQMLGKRGYDVSIYAVFDLSAYSLANLLNEWQHRYGR
ncbi:MAG: hypothetical protein PUP93_04845 [Rhizonema sp. NSF051]|nr:hypothetical protein [Rhizonema sp. NSF051]